MWSDLFANMSNTNFFNFSFLPKYLPAFVKGFEYTLCWRLCRWRWR